jgi:hypothetical protein
MVPCPFYVFNLVTKVCFELFMCNKFLFLIEISTTFFHNSCGVHEQEGTFVLEIHAFLKV